jgi:hypothetical protein
MSPIEREQATRSHRSWLILATIVVAGAGCGGKVGDDSAMSDGSDSGDDVTASSDGGANVDGTTSADASGAADGGLNADSGDGADDSSADDSACGGGSSGMCNTVAELGQRVPITCVIGTAPSMTGGTIGDGTYVLTSVTVYTANCIGGLAPANRSTVVVLGACMQNAADPWVTAVIASSFSWTAATDMLTLRETCPGTMPDQVMLYSADPMKYVTSAPYFGEFADGNLVGQVVSEYDKQ